MTGSSSVDVFDDRVCVVGEGPFYDMVRDRVGWVDIEGSKVLWRDLGTSRYGEIELPGHVGAALDTSDGGLVVCLPDALVLRHEDGSLTPLAGYADADRAAGVEPAKTAMRSNDAKVDPAGRAWVSTMAYDVTPGAGALYRLDPVDGVLTRMIGGCTIGNGLGWSPDSRTMYYIDSPTGRVDTLDYDVSSGTTANRRALIEIPADNAMPDGMCVDAEGGLWVALWGGWAVHRYAPDGSLDRVIDLLAAQVSSCAFVGTSLDRLVVTTAARDRDEPGAGKTYILDPGVRGLPVPAMIVDAERGYTPLCVEDHDGASRGARRRRWRAGRRRLGRPPR